MFSKSDNVEIMVCSITSEIINELYESLLNRYQEGLLSSMRGSKFIFDNAECLNYVFHKVEMKRSRSYIKSPEWIKNKKATINYKNKDDKCFKYVVTIALNYDEMKEKYGKAYKVNEYSKRHDRTDINYPPHVNDWKTFERNNKFVALNVLYAPEGEMTVRHAYKSKYNLKRENQVILLMINEGEKWHYLTVKSLSALLYKITSKQW